MFRIGLEPTTQTVSVFYSTAELPKLKISNQVSLEKAIYEIYINCLGVLMRSSITIYCMYFNNKKYKWMLLNL